MSGDIISHSTEELTCLLPNDLSPTTTVTDFLFVLCERDMHSLRTLSSYTVHVQLYIASHNENTQYLNSNFLQSLPT